MAEVRLDFKGSTDEVAGELVRMRNEVVGLRDAYKETMQVVQAEAKKGATSQDALNGAIVETGGAISDLASRAKKLGDSNIGTAMKKSLDDAGKATEKLVNSEETLEKAIKKTTSTTRDFIKADKDRKLSSEEVAEAQRKQVEAFAEVAKASTLVASQEARAAQDARRQAAARAQEERDRLGLIQEVKAAISELELAQQAAKSEEELVEVNNRLKEAKLNLQELQELDGNQIGLLQQLQDRIDALNKRKLTLTNPADIAAVNDEIQGVQQELETLATSTSKTGGAIGGVLDRLKGGISNFASQVPLVGGMLSALGPIGIAVGVIAGGLFKIAENTNAGKVAIDGFGRASGIVFDKLTGTVTSFLSSVTDKSTLVGKVIGGIGDALEFVLIKANPVIAALEALGVLDTFKNAYEEAMQLARAYDELEDREIALLTVNEERERQIRKLNVSIQDQTKSEAERLEISDKIAKLEKARLGQETAILRAKTGLLKVKADQELRDIGEVSTATKKAIAEAQAAEIKAASDSEALSERLQNRVNTIRDQGDRERQAANEKAIARLKQAADETLRIEQDLADRLRGLQEEAAAPGERLVLQRASAEQELRVLEETLKRQNEIRGQGNALTAAQEEQLAVIRIEIQSKYARESAALDAEFAEQRIALMRNKSDREKAEFEASLRTREDALRRAGASELELEQFLDDQRAAFLQERELAAIAQEESIALARIDAMERGAESERQFRVRVELVRLDEQARAAERRLKAIKDDGTAETALLIQQTENVIRDINAKRAELEGQAQPIGLFELLGLNLSEKEIQSVKDSLAEIGGAIQSAIAASMQAQAEALEAQISTTDQTIDDQRRRKDELLRLLDLELQAQRDGYANNADAVRRELALVGEAEAREVERRKELQKEQARLAKQQAVIDSAAQASALVTANANLFKTGSLKGIPGILAATAFAIGMIGTFASLRARVKASTVPEYADGTTFVDKPGRFRRGIDTVPAMLTRGEAVVPVAPNSKYPGLVEGLVENDHAKLQRAAIEELLRGTGIKLMPDAGQKAMTIRDSAARHNSKESESSAEMLKELKYIRAELESFKSQERNKSTVTPVGGKVVVSRPGRISKKR